MTFDCWRKAMRLSNKAAAIKLAERDNLVGELVGVLEDFVAHDDAWEKESRDGHITTSRADEYLAKFMELKNKARTAIAKAREGAQS